MCLSTSSIRSAAQWNWDGDHIVYKPVIPASRRIPGTRKRYQIDIREFIARKDSAVIKNALDDITKGLSDRDRAHFLSRHAGSFDFRMRKSESGLWMLVEPLLYTRRARRHASTLRSPADAVSPDTFEYIPFFVFNDEHLPTKVQAQHEGERGDVPERKENLFRGENKRKRLGLPLLRIKV